MNEAVIVTIKTPLPLRDTHFVYSLCIKCNFKESFTVYHYSAALKKGTICE